MKLPGALIPLILRATHANRPFVTADGAHQRVRERALRPQPYGPPARLAGVRVRRRIPDPGGWPVFDVVAAPGAQHGDPRSAPVLVYVHGGGWVNEIVSPHWSLIARIARETGQRVVVPIYPLVPFATARQVRDGVVALVRSERAAGREVRIAGDSAGGQISLSVALALRDDGIVLPATTLISPALDLSWSNPGIDLVQPSDPWLARPGGRVLAEYWRGDDALSDPVVSPITGELNGLGPITIVTGTRDVLNPDAHLLRRRAEEAGVTVTWIEGEGQVHVYPLLPTREGERGRAAVIRSLQP
ncbi:MAG: alpha/beta hydrolase fold domain-containing protein [Mycetocola sp.]